MPKDSWPETGAVLMHYDTGGVVLYQDEDGYFWFSVRDDDFIMESGKIKRKEC